MSWGNSSSNPLNGQHLKIIWPNWEGNPKAMVGPLKGKLIIDYLADRFHFTYEMVRVTETQLDIPVGGRGLFSYLVNGESDFLVYGTVPTAERLKIIDITTPWYYSTLEFLIPVLDDVANIDAVAKPFQWIVWLLLFVSIVVVLFGLHQLRKYESRTFQVTSRTSTSASRRNSDSKPQSKTETGDLYLYVFGNLLSQGGVCKSKRLPFRFVAGAWTLGAFIFVQAYNSTLITYVITPSRYPLIYSAYDIAKDPNIVLFIRKASTSDRIISDPNSKGKYAKLRDRLNSVPDSRCTYQWECVDRVKPGMKNIFLETYLSHVDIIKAEYDSTGSCKTEIARDPLVSIIAGFGLQKRSPFTNSISTGLMELLENGILNHWDLWFRSMPQKCLANIKAATKKTKKNDHVSLSMKNLSGSFVVLAVGLTLSIVAFVGEQIASRFGSVKAK